jgi:hypothetical protein
MPVQTTCRLLAQDLEHAAEQLATEICRADHNMSELVSSRADHNLCEENVSSRAGHNSREPFTYAGRDFALCQCVVQDGLILSCANLSFSRGSFCRLSICHSGWAFVNLLFGSSFGGRFIVLLVDERVLA